MELRVKLPMIVKVDNNRAVDLANGWSVSGGTKHMEVQIAFARELKENEIIKVEWTPSEENELDIFTKSVETKLFNKHVATLSNGI